MFMPTIVCGRGTGRSGMEVGLAPLSALVVTAPASAAAGALLAVVTALALPAAPALPASCLLSQAAEASKISVPTQASHRMRVD
jgi:hypothetical protein